MAGKVNRGINNGTAPPTFSINGQNYHSIGSLIPNNNERPRFAQLYIYDIDNEVSNRIFAVRSSEIINKLETEIVSELTKMLDMCNPLAKSFRFARDRFADSEPSEIKMRLIRKREKDGRVYNLPTASEVAILIVGDIDDSILDRDIIIQSTANKLQRIDVLHPLYLALQYPLIFPYGEDGFRTGYPSFFITITCNPEWDEIKRSLKDTGLKAQDRPDIVSRIFNLKLGQLIADFKHGQFFGKITACKFNEIYYVIHVSKLKLNNELVSTGICTVEFQKRGLPHAHILLFMHPLSKPKSPDDIDKLISAEILDKIKRPKLYGAVEKYMVHGPCGKYNSKSPCMLNGRCSKYYPKPFRSRTMIDDGGFPKYKRMDNGRIVTKNNTALDNSYIVPYNPSLLLKYGCHINVEHTCQTSAIKYLFKYVHKGNDRVTASFYQTNVDGDSEQVVDEIRNYYDCRYISACEAAWRIFGYDIQQKEPSVIRLPFHLPNEHPVIFRDYENIVDVIDRVDGKLTKLLAWMLTNRLFSYGRTLTYSQFPNKFVWKDDISMWMPRKQGFFIVNGVVYGTFKEACYALGLLQDDKEFIDAIIEASTWASGNYLRVLFVVLLLSNNVVRPEVVWEQCYHVLSEDILFCHRKNMQCADLKLSPEQIMNMTLAKIEDKLQGNGRSLKEFDKMPYPSSDVIDGLEDRLLLDELNFDVDALTKELNNNLSNMNIGQRKAFDVIIQAVNGNAGGFFFVYGCGGTGKTYLYRTLSAAIRSKRGIVLNVASSGIASLLLPNGRTVHSRFKIPLELTEDSVCCIKQGTSLAKLICKARLIIWDEAPMLNKLCYEALDKCFRDILSSEPYYNAELPFGGKVVVLGGDFRQILPVIPMGSRYDIIHSAINASYLWQHCTVLTLTVNMRLTIGPTDKAVDDVIEFSKWLLDIGDGLVGDSMDGESEVHIHPDILIHDSIRPFDDMVEFVYPNLLANITQPSYFKHRSILGPTLEVVNEVNTLIMDRLEGDEKIYLSCDSLCVEEGNMESDLDTITPDVLNAISCSGLPPHQLTLKVGVPVMLLRNIDQSNGLCNGTRLQVRKLGNHVVECMTLTGNKVGQVVIIPRMDMIPTNQGLPFRFQRRQFPIIVSFAMTINKSQGQTLTTVGLYLPRPVFSHGQLYAALSRVKSKNGLRVLIQNNKCNVATSTINVVYREIFGNIH
ncbi:uncharacterized protein [Arachis hypogaea]|uniref:uncharacterized protein n=1 Tax=Arachis hypogaea TaxID=3818 RepID=UPI000DEC7C44|nr:uncharacterized protein LOC112780515 [Arachis hypogaea]